MDCAGPIFFPIDMRLHLSIKAQHTQKPTVRHDGSATMYPSHQQLAYAPTPYSYTPSNHLTATINLDEEVRLADTAAERDLYESLAEIYSIIVTLDALEKAYLRDSIRENEYTETCDRLLRQYKNCLGDENVERAFGDLERFKQEWDLDAPKATERLRIGLPATLSTDPTSTSAAFRHLERLHIATPISLTQLRMHQLRATHPTPKRS